MRTSLLIFAFTALAVRGEEPVASTVRQKLHAVILASVPPPSPPPPPTKPAEDSLPAFMMAPVVVSETNGMRAIIAAIDREKQSRQDEKFTALDGGKIYNIGRVQIGSWYSPGEGWTFLRLNKAPTRRQTEAVETRLKELNELLKFGEKTQP